MNWDKDALYSYDAGQGGRAGIWAALSSILTVFLMLLAIAVVLNALG